MLLFVASGIGFVHPFAMVLLRSHTPLNSLSLSLSLHVYMYANVGPYQPNSGFFSEYCPFGGYCLGGSLLFALHVHIPPQIFSLLVHPHYVQFFHCQHRLVLVLLEIERMDAAPVDEWLQMVHVHSYRKVVSHVQSFANQDAQDSKRSTHVQHFHPQVIRPRTRVPSRIHVCE